MNDHDLLAQYEPVLRFAKSERFFPMAVEHYLDRCTILPSGPLGAAGLLFHLNESPATMIGKLEGGQYYLRFINEPLYDSDAWVWLGVSSVLAMGAGYYFFGWTGVQIAVALELTAALILFMLASTIRLRIIPAALVALLIAALLAAPIWFFLRPSEVVSTAVEYFLLLPIYLLLVFYFSIRTMKFIFDRIVPELPGVMMDMLSQATETIARKSYFEYAKILEKDPQPVYYGRVVREQDAEGNNWTILQYHFFYAFNDWRLAANGMNHHEGDWEMVAVYLKNDSPYVVLFSQHGAGNIELWEHVIKAKDRNEKDTTHPVVYVALGSHANYSKPQVIRSPNLYEAGFVQRLIYWVDGLIHYLFLLFNPSQKARQIALKELTASRTNFLAGDAFIYMRDEADHYVVSLPMELASGDGFRIGHQGENLREPVVKSTSYLKRVMSDRKVTRPSVKEWRRVVLNPEPDWVNYKGLWGVKSVQSDESGPPGPKWDRPDNLFNVNPRVRWEKPLEWLKMLENHKK